MKKNIVLLFVALIAPAFVLAELPLNEVPPQVILSGKNGGYVDGRGAWDSTALQGKVSVIFYVDPDVKDLNDKASDALSADDSLGKAREAGNFASYAIINMAATWIPNIILDGVIKENQKEFSNTIFVFDRNEVLHKEWKIATDNSDVIVLDKEGKVVFSKDGKLSDFDIQAMLKAIHASL